MVYVVVTPFKRKLTMLQRSMKTCYKIQVLKKCIRRKNANCIKLRAGWLVQ